MSYFVWKWHSKSCEKKRMLLNTLRILNKCKILAFDRKGYKHKSMKSLTYKKFNKKGLVFVSFKKVNISSSQLRKI